jgi:PAS domain S-box-containing protein
MNTSISDTDKSTAGIIALSRNYGVMCLNHMADKLLGCGTSPGDIWPLDKLFAADNLVHAQFALEKVFIDGNPRIGLHGNLLHTDGHQIPCLYSALPLFGNGRDIIGVILNIRRMRAESVSGFSRQEPSKPSNKSLIHKSVLVDHLPAGVFTVDTSLRIMAFNKAAQSITGFEEKKVVGHHCWDIFRSDKCGKECPVRLTLNKGEPQRDQEVPVYDRRGGRQTLLVNINILKDKQGKVLGAIETIHPTETFLPAMPDVNRHFRGVVGSSQGMRTIFSMLPDIATSNANVLISGESGTGKELIARTLHSLSDHSERPFVAVNCSALAESLLESELFGHEKGAFTGADHAKPGRFELAGEGTLFLDEIGELKPDLQVKLLRVIEQRRFERVGGSHSIQFRARIICATNQNLKQALAKGRFREDLYYRLRTVPLALPPLRQRLEDIPLLIDHFIQKYNAATGKTVCSIDPKVMQLLVHYDWPGNIRELEHCIEHAFVFAKGPVIFKRHIPDLDALHNKTVVKQKQSKADSDPQERNSIIRALEQSCGRRREAAALLGISRTSLWRRMKEYRLNHTNDKLNLMKRRS